MPVRVGDLGPVDLYETRPGLHEAASEKAALAEGGTPVAITDGGLLLLEIEGRTRAAGDHEAQGLLRILIEIKMLNRLREGWHAAIDEVEQALAPRHPQAAELRAKGQVAGVDLVHLRVVEVIARGIEIERIVGTAEETRGACLADHAAFLQRPRHHNEGQHGNARRQQLGDVRADIREVFRRGGLELAGGTDLVGGIAGEHLVHRRGVIEETHRRVAHRTDKGEFVGYLSDVGQQLGNLHARNLGLDRLEDALDIGGASLLGVPEVQVARSTLQVDQDNALGLAPAGAAGAGMHFLGGDLLQFEHLGKAQPYERRASDAQQFPPRKTSIAGHATLITGYDQHSSSSLGGFQT